MDKSDYINIGRRIRRARKNKNLSQENLAEMANLSVAHISHIETANTALSLPSLVGVANALDVSTDALLCDCLKNPGATYKQEISAFVEDCSDQEIRIVADLVPALKHSLRKHRR